MLHAGTCLINIGQSDEAVTLLKEAIQVAPPDSPYLADIYQELAFAYSEKGLPDEAINCLNMTSTLDCDHVQVLVVKGHIMLAAGQLEEAEKYFRDAVIYSDDATQTLLRVIVSLYDNHYFEASYKMLHKFFQIAPKDNKEGYAYMALCCYDMKKYEEYLKYLKTACKLNPKECRMVLAHLFPKDIEPEHYYDYMKEKLNS